MDGRCRYYRMGKCFCDYRCDIECHGKCGYYEKYDPVAIEKEEKEQYEAQFEVKSWRCE